MIYFVILYIFLVFSFIIEIKPATKNICYLFASVVLILFAGLRGDIEPDYSSYYDIFKRSLQQYDKYFGVEVGYFYINKFINNLGLGFQSVIFIMAVLSISLKIRFFKQNSPNFALSSLIYYSSAYFLYDFIAIRQALAIGAFMWAIPLITEKKFLKYLAVILLTSFLVHYSALVLLPLYFVVNREYNKKLLYAIFLFCLVINVLNISLPILDLILEKLSITGALSSKLKIYSQEKEFIGSSIRQLLFLFLFIFFRNKYINDKYSNIYLNLYMFGVLLSILLNSVPQFSYRIRAYFFWTDAILIPLIICSLIPNKNNLLNRFILYVLVAILATISLYSLLDNLDSRGYIYPYIMNI